jgi:filamin
MDINGSPFALKAFDANRLIVSEIPRLVTLNQAIEFSVDASKAGEGQLEVAINDGLVPNQVKALGNSKFLFTFVPKTSNPHILSIKFNGQQLTGKCSIRTDRLLILINVRSGFPKECQVFSTEDITTRGPGLNQALLGDQTWFTVDTPQANTSDIQVTVQTPNNEQLTPSTRLTADGLRVDWIPAEVGTYTVHVNFAGNAVPGSPFRVKCYDPKKVIVTPPSSDSTIRKPTRFLSMFPLRLDRVFITLNFS